MVLASFAAPLWSLTFTDHSLLIGGEVTARRQDMEFGFLGGSYSVTFTGQTPKLHSWTWVGSALPNPGVVFIPSAVLAGSAFVTEIAFSTIQSVPRLRGR